MTPCVSSLSITSTVVPLKRSLHRLAFIARHFSLTNTNMTKSYKVAQVSDLKDGQMKEVDIPGAEGKVLISRVQGNFYATGARCTRKYFKPFGDLMQYRLRCSLEERGFEFKRKTCLSLAW